MALVVKDRVKETSITAGTGTLTLDGAAPGFQSFAAIGNGNTTYYTIVDNIANTWEVGVGTYTASGTTLSRDTVLANSLGTTALINFASNSKDVFVTYPAGRSVYSDGTNIVPATSAFLPVANGGTGQTTYTDGQLLIGNSTGNTLTKATLTQGTGVTITNGSGSITISATGTGGTVTSVDVSGGTTGLTTSGGPITGSGTITIGGTLAVASGGTGATTIAGAQTNLQVDPAGTAVAMAIALG